MRYANQATCYVHKRSHAGTPIHVSKTLADLIFLNRQYLKDDEENFYQFLTVYQLELLQLLKQEAESRDKDRKKRINFNKPTEEFFKPAGHLREYDHDKLHEATKRWDKPLYLENLKYPDKALIDNDKFFARDFEYRLTMVQEESCVLGLERAFIGKSVDLSPQKIYQLGLTDLISKMSKGRFQDFMLNNIHCLTKPKWDYFNQFLTWESKLND